MRKFGLIFLAASFLLGTTAICQQPVTVDWRTKTLGSHPTVVDRTTDILIRIENANDVLFTYSIVLSGTPREHFDFSEISKAFPVAGAGEAALCSPVIVTKAKTDSQALIDALNNLLKLPETITSGCSAAAPCDVTIGQTQDNWDKNVAVALKTASEKSDQFRTVCKDPSYKKAQDAIDDAIKKANNLHDQIYREDHTITKKDVLEPDVDYKLTVAQFYNSVQTKNGSVALDLKPINNRLTLSAGALFSEVQNRSYSSLSAPNPAGTGTNNVLSVAGLSRFSPSALALLNYALPNGYGDWDDFGFALSTGPVLRLGSKSDTASFGYFGGVSFHLYHRLFITAGEHLGEFADFPPGFTAVNQVVPSGLGTPTPVKRWTWRFAIGVSYKAKDFSSFGISGSTTTGDAKAGQSKSQSPNNGNAAGGNSGNPAKASPGAGNNNKTPKDNTGSTPPPSTPQGGSGSPR